MKNKRLLLIRTDAIGDYILFRNFIKILAQSEKYKDYKIDILCHQSWYELSREIDKKYINKFLTFNTERYRVDNWYKISLENRLNLQKYDTIINPTYSRTFLTDTLISNIKAKTKIGNIGDLSNISLEDKNISDKYYTKLIKSKDKYLFEFDRNRVFFENLLKQKINLDKTEILYKDFIQLPFKNYIVFVIAANSIKRKWSIENYTYNAKKFYSLGYEIVICGGDGESKDVEKFKVLFGNNFINLVGKTSLFDMLSILKYSKFVISNDTGLAHISIALKKQTFIISNGNHFGRFVPYPKQYDSFVHSFFPFDYQKDINYFYGKYYNGSDLDINLITYDKVLDFLPINKKIRQNNKHNYQIFNINSLKNNAVKFSKDFNRIYNQIIDINESIIVYGNGTIGKTIQALILDKIIGYVDIADENNHPKNLLNMKYDKIIISVLGREEEIIKYLVDDLKIDKKKIITFEI